ncbi:hypothetical protein LTR94_024482 [Friedmanniomyces endolithicus]|nr:hypothetical protein LTR94_024482 [Friedmanniomyces endolithicus]
MRPKRLWGLRKDIFGLGATQVLACGLLMTAAAMAVGVPAATAFVGAMGFVLSSTAVIMQMLEERGELAGSSGQRAVSILLLEDLAIVPLLAIVAVLATLTGRADEHAPPLWQTIGFAVAAVGGVLVAGKYLVDPLFRVLARYGGREVMTAAALLVVVSSAWAMSLGGLSMAMGAFLAGVLLSESTFRHQLEADVEPFRAILLGLFFLSDWRIVLGGVAGFMVVKSIGIYGVARLFKASHREALERAALFAQGGEFAFVLYGAAVVSGLFSPVVGAMLSAIVILSMALTPLTTLLVNRLLPKEALSPDEAEGVDFAKDLRGQVLIIGFGRFAQVVSQPLLARDVDVSIIENDVEMIQAASQFGFKVYYGDGTRLDTLRASGAEKAELVLVCVDKPEATDRIVELVKHEFPTTRVMARAFDRGHSMRLIEAGVDYQIRETFESALKFGERALIELGLEEIEAAETIGDVRRRDDARLDLQLTGGISAGRQLMRGNMATPQPAPYIKPKREGRLLNEDEPEPQASQTAGQEPKETAGA